VDGGKSQQAVWTLELLAVQVHFNYLVRVKSSREKKRNYETPLWNLNVQTHVVCKIMPYAPKHFWASAEIIVFS